MCRTNQLHEGVRETIHTETIGPSVTFAVRSVQLVYRCSRGFLRNTRPLPGARSFYSRSTIRIFVRISACGYPRRKLNNRFEIARLPSILRARCHETTSRTSFARFNVKRLPFRSHRLEIYRPSSTKHRNLTPCDATHPVSFRHPLFSPQR